jgi:predicted permease
MAIIIAFLLAGSAALIGGIALVLAAVAAGLFWAVRHYRWRTPPLDAMRSAVSAVLMLGTATNLPLGVAAFSPAGIDDLRVVAALAASALGQVASFAAYRWSMAERQPDRP